MSIVVNLLISFVILINNKVDNQYCDFDCSDMWLQYKDDVFMAVVYYKTRYSYADQLCRTKSAKLVVIDSPEKQKFVEKVIQESGVEDNAWIGLNRTDQSYQWSDGTDLSFTNWSPGEPNSSNSTACVQIYAESYRWDGKAVTFGKWDDLPCDSKRVFICEKKRKIHSKLTTGSANALIEETRDSGSETQGGNGGESGGGLFGLVRGISSGITGISGGIRGDIKSIITEIQNDIAKLKSLIHIIPIGFIYTQLGNQSAPADLWPIAQWEDITAQYSGLFFRAEGSGSGVFGEIQEEFAPRITEAKVGRVEHNYNVSDFAIGKWSSYLCTGADDDVKGCWSSSFYTTAGEIRPRNIAIKLWKRVK
ncbi:macrophage mannose receptor 1-like [Oppia nitens]|uniref:macrophage mannose receptor 1-like n=1 Tax=Oppia nitens TaxID=1686743 RepID=UPI0023DA9E17|nr:macrophage mannose receptor 1-like [Oppia nitens]